MKFLKNVWVKRGVSLVCYLYAVLMAWLGFNSFFYDTEIVNFGKYIGIFLVISLVALVLMLYSRKQVLTSILAMILMFLSIPVVFLNVHNLWVAIPVIFVALTIFFGCGASEMVKTVFGTIFLLGYILGALAFFIVINLFITKTNDTLITENVSPTGEYRYYIMDIQNQSEGNVVVYVEPNNLDFDKFGIHFRATGYKQRKYNHRGHEIPEVEWGTTSNGNECLIIKDSNSETPQHYEIGEFEWSMDVKEILL